MFTSSVNLKIHHLIWCQTVTLCRGSWPQIPSRLKTNDPANPEIRDLQRVSDDRNCMAPLSHRRGGPKWKATKRSLEQPETIGIVKGLQFSFKLCSVQSRRILLVLPDFSCLVNYLHVFLSLGLLQCTYLDLPGIMLGSVLLSFPTLSFQSDCWKFYHGSCIHSSRGRWLGCLAWHLPAMASSPSKSKGEDARANNNPDSPAGVCLLVPRRPSTAVLPPGVKLVSRSRTHTANVSLVWH